MRKMIKLFILFIFMILYLWSSFRIRLWTFFLNITNKCISIDVGGTLNVPFSLKKSFKVQPTFFNSFSVDRWITHWYEIFFLHNHFGIITYYVSCFSRKLDILYVILPASLLEKNIGKKFNFHFAHACLDPLLDS